MADPVKKRILSAIDSRLKSILKVNGYETDAGENVFYWRTEPIPEDRLPGIVYRDTVNRVEVGAGGLYENTLTVEIRGYAAGSGDEETKALVEKIGADIEKAVSQDDTWGGLALTTEKESEECDLERRERVYGQATVTVNVEYRTNRWDAYA